MKNDKQKTECPYFQKIVFKKMEMVNAGTPNEWDLFEEPQIEDLEIEINDAEQNIPCEGKTNQIKVSSYHSAEKMGTSPSLSQPSQIEGHEIISIKMPKIFKSGGLCERLNHNQEMNIPKKNQQKMRQKIMIKEQELDIENLEVQQQQSIKALFMNKNQTQNRHLLTSLFSGFVKLITEKQTKICYLQLDEKTLKISSKNQKFTNLIHIEYFILLEKYRLDFDNQKQSLCLSISVCCKKYTSKIIIEFYERANKEIFKDVYYRNLQRIYNKKNQAYQCSLSLASLDSFQFEVERTNIHVIEKQLDNFDLILFKGRGMMPKMQRFFTNSPFDHVGLIMKAYDGEILLLEATGNSGVAIYSFASIHKAVQRKCYERIAFRKLLYSQNPNFFERNRSFRALETFVRNVNGKQYKFDPRYLLWPKNKRPPSNHIPQQKQLCQQEEQTYFCSQLVAEALKHSGIMKKQTTKPSCGYLPKHFSQIDNLNEDMNNGYSYSELIVII